MTRSNTPRPALQTHPPSQEHRIAFRCQWLDLRIGRILPKRGQEIRKLINNKSKRLNQVQTIPAPHGAISVIR
jgi:hypothetical protein